MIDNNEFLARIERQLHGDFGWEEHESAAWTTAAGGQRSGEPNFSHRCRVVAHLARPGPTSVFPPAQWWRWTVKVGSGGIVFRARGYTHSKEEGKTACERAVRILALGILAQFNEEVERR